jgi:nitrogen fixation/metabolism regulation signal transduction histidine kinase
MTVFIWSVGGAGLLGIALVGGATFRTAKRAAGRVHELVAGTERIAAGDLEYRVQLPADDELGRLAGALNTMASELAGARRGLEARKSAILESSLDGLLTVTPQGLVEEFNSAAVRMFAIPREEAIGLPVGRLIGGAQFERGVLAGDGTRSTPKASRACLRRSARNTRPSIRRPKFTPTWHARRCPTRSRPPGTGRRSFTPAGSSIWACRR